MKHIMLVVLLSLPLLVQASGLELYYDFEDAMGSGSIQDSAGTGLFASRHSSRQTEISPAGVSDVPAPLSSRSRAALDTNGGFLWVRNGATVGFGENMSLNLWLKTGKLENQRSTFLYSLGGWRLLYNRSAKRFEFQTFGETGKTITFDLVLGERGEWNMLTLVKKSTSLSLYLNAKKINTVTCDPELPPGGGFYIGCASTSGRYGYTGLLDDFAVWSSAITERQINELYTGVSPLECMASERLTQTITSPLPDTLEAYFPPADFALSKNGEPRAVIVEADMDGFTESGKKIQRALLDARGIKFPIIGWEDARKSDKNLILFGPVNANGALRQLNANFLLGDNDRGYELRAIPDALDWGKGVLYLGGKTAEEVSRGTEALLAKFQTLEKIPFFIDCEGWDQQPTQEELDAMVAEIEELYSRFGDGKNKAAVDTMLKNAVVQYKMTGCDAYAATFAKMAKVFADHFEEGRLPTFRFHLFAQYLYNVEHSPEFTSADRLLAAEFLRKVTEEIMDFWEMTEAKKLYQLSKQEYLENHQCFASRSVEASARYLLSRYGYEPAKYWKAVADNAFAGVAPHPFSPEDAAGYQYLVYRIFVDYAMASGKYSSGFLKENAFKEYIDTYAKPMMNHLGYTAGYGDAYPTGMSGSWILLKQAMDILGDRDAEFLLDLIRRTSSVSVFGTTIDQWGVRRDLPPPGKDSLGLQVVDLKPFKQKRYQLWGLYKRPALDKAVFRSGWDKYADFMAVTGINGGSHGHFDANGISQYISGDRLWLLEGDYIKKFPYDHNSIVVCRDGKVAEQQRKVGLRNKSRASQIVAAVQTPDRNLALLSTLLEDYNGVDWIRNIGYAATNGFWVIDELEVKKEGHYAIQCYWRSAGQFDPQPQAVGFVQTPSADPMIANRFFITEGSGAARTMHSEFDFCHGRKDGTLSGYKFAGKSTRYLIQRHDGDCQAGKVLRFVNFMRAVPEPPAKSKNRGFWQRFVDSLRGDPEKDAPEIPVVRKLSPDAFFAVSGDFESLAVMGRYSAPEIEVDADLCIVNADGIVARGATHIKLGAFEWKSPEKSDCALKIDVAKVNRLFETLKGKGTVVASGKPGDLPAPILPMIGKVEFSSPVTKVSACADLIGVGEESGLFSVFDTEGRKLFDHPFPKAISAILSVKLGGETQWAVAVQPEDRKVGDAALYLLDDSGKVVWENKIESFHKRNGTVQTLFTARINGEDNPPAIIAGSEAWHYYAFSLDGKEIWRAPVFHGATVGAAGDMNGDGKEDIAPGIEYYYHSLINSQGATGAKKTTSPFDYSVAVCDLNSDGVDEAIFGRGDGYLYVMTPPENNYRNWSLNVGGKPVALVELNHADSVLAAATDTGVITFIDALGKKTGTTYLPAPVSDMKFWEGKLLATALDGYAYVMDLQGQVQSKIQFQHDINSVHPAGVAVAGKTAAIHSGSTVYLVK